MRYLVVTISRYPIPPEMGVGLLDAMSKWAERYTAVGKIEQIWSFAGIRGGAGVMNVDSLEELDQIMTEFPLAPFSKVWIDGLVDLQQSLDQGKKTIAAMTAR
jgi:muconolactone delta-isomerase